MNYKIHFLSAFFLALMLLPAVPASAGPQIVAVIIPGDLPRYGEAHAAFLKILESGGYGEDKVKVFVQKPNADRMSITNSLRRASSAGADLFITYGGAATDGAAQEAKKSVVLFADVYDPVGLGIVNTLSAPGVNRSGASSMIPMAPLLEALSAIVPGKKIGVLYSGDDKDSVLQVQEFQTLAQKLGFSLLKQDVGTPQEAAGAVGKLAGEADVLFLSNSLMIGTRTQELLALASAKKLPVISQIPGLAEQGALINLEADPDEQGKLLGVHTLQVLGGQKAFILPVRSPKKMALVINLKTAGALGLSVPAKTLAAATRVVR
ncbi:ABC transporter, periplasmic substrate-binding protein [Desulfuromonas soudanensis]|uniref:ABC transporter, periplasmic substrate-binding protein n=1 Tax=Desulfuromonas soudanensis TaxID=1603606 RepID=A0A0M4D3C9_9BACT|nr:ABC transporter substrate-binding protein [Desulfuromonas soudanensis]ALC17940.1 ABC transporter, periplasmic substrate-binding protein [Desulfuromonas soudanensis]